MGRLVNNQRQTIQGMVRRVYPRQYRSRADDCGYETAYRMQVDVVEDVTYQPGEHAINWRTLIILSGTVPRDILSGLKVGDIVKFDADVELDHLGFHGRFKRPTAATVIARPIKQTPRVVAARPPDDLNNPTLSYWETPIGR